MQPDVSLIDLVKSFPTNIWLRKLQPRKSLSKFVQFSSYRTQFSRGRRGRRGRWAPAEAPPPRARARGFLAGARGGHRGGAAGDAGRVPVQLRSEVNNFE